MPGQPQLTCNPMPPPPFVIAIDCTALTVEQPYGVPSDLIIDPGKSWFVWAYFKIGGPWANWFNALIAAGIVEYKVTYYYEGYGKLPEGVLAIKECCPSKPGVRNDAACLPGPCFEYGKDQTRVEAKPDETLLPGTYKTSCTITFCPGKCCGKPAPLPPFLLTAFFEGPLIQIPET